MSSEFTLTPCPVRVSTAEKQALDQALDVSAYRDADVSIGVVCLEGSTPDVTIRLLTGMCNRIDDGWIEVASSGSVTTTNKWTKVATTGLLKYLRWEVEALTGDAATFVISGMLRKQ